MGLQRTAWAFEHPKRPESQKRQVNQEIIRGIDLLYVLQFDEAEDIFRNLIAQSPEDPQGYFYLAMVTWSRLANGFLGSETVREYKKRIDRTIQVAEGRIRHISATSNDFFYLGGALGFKGRFELMRGKWLSSFFLSRDAIDALETSLEMEPDNRDVLLGLGIFDYYTAHLSGALKFLTYLLLHRGNKKEGMRKLHLAASEAIYSKTEAKSMLLHIYLFIEEDFPKALKLALDLARKYEENPRYIIFAGVCYIRLGMDLQYGDMVDLLRRKGMEASTEKEASMWNRRALYLETIYYLYNGPYAEARLKLRLILHHPDPENDPLMIAWPLAKIGMSYDLDGDREEAIKYYQQVLNMANGAGAQFFAKKYIGNAPQKNDPFIAY
ncbi:MAG: hypothetical protein GY849_03260 [Deltaproteobacteria bacterium]|nr:hypothetical protein [Deltaproteobacteria bacterium]